MSLNKVMLIGHLGSDPELRFTPGGAPVANFNLATNERWTDKNGQSQEKTEWHKIVVWGKTAENVGKYLKKGRQVFIEGRLQTRDWEDKDGNKRYTTEVRADTVQFLSGGNSEGGGGGGGGRRDYGSSNNEPGPEASFDQSFKDDDIPF